MSKLRVTWWYTQAFWSKYRKIIAISIVLGVILVWLFPTLVQYLPRQRQTKYIGRVGYYSWSEIPIDIQSKISSGLTALDETGQPVPVLALRWTVEEDGRAFRFLLKDNLRWQDGKPFTAEDVNYSFTDVQTVASDNTVLFRLQDAYAPFPTVVSQPLFRQERRTRLGFIKENKIIGLGEYEVIKLTHQGSRVKELIIENQSERLVYRFYLSEDELIDAFRLGQVDIAEGLTSLANLLETEQQMYTVDESIHPRQFVAIFFNTTDPNLTKEIRQALNYATRKPGPQDEKLRALTPIPPVSWAYNTTEEIEPFAFNLQKALDLYETADPAQPLSLTIDTPLPLLEEAQKIAEDWRNLGSQAKINCETSQDVDERGCGRFAINAQVRILRDLQDFQVALLAREAPSDPDQYGWWHSTQSNNISGYQNPRVDKLLEDARKETNQQRRKLMYFEFQKYLVEDVPAIFMYYLPEYTLYRHVPTE